MNILLTLLLVFNFFSLYSTFCSFFFFFNDTATTEIYTLSLHDALPIFPTEMTDDRRVFQRLKLTKPILSMFAGGNALVLDIGDRKSTRLNSSHSQISYAVFCLKKKKNNKSITNHHLYNKHNNNIKNQYQ